MNAVEDEDDYIDCKNPFKFVPSDICDDAASSDSSGDAEDMKEPEDEAYPPDLAAIEWQLSKGAKGHLHLACTHDTCGRSLRGQSHGVGLSQAFSLRMKWSPRCFAGLPKHAQAWWRGLPVEHAGTSDEEG